MKNRLPSELPHLLVIATMLIASALSWTTLPERIPIHWNARGEIDGYGGKLVGLLVIPLVASGMYLLFRFLPRLDPGRANYPSFARPYAILRFSILVLLAGIHASMLLAARGWAVPMDRVAGLLIGGLFVVLGGVLGKIRPNWFVGVRTPWTLSSKTSWVKTHRLAGWLMLASGALTIAAALLLPPPYAFVVLMAGVIGSTVVSLVYSYRVWRDDPDKLAVAGTLPADEG